MSFVEAARLFDASFHSTARKITEELTAVSNLPTLDEKSKVLNKCLEDIATLQRSAQDASSYATSHDQAAYATTLKKLQSNANDTRVSITPKAKFKFKSARQTAAKQETSDANAGSSTAGSIGHIESKAVPSSYDILGTSALSRTGQNILLSSDRLKDRQAASLSGLSRCIVDLVTEQQNPHASLNITNAHESLLLCGTVGGSVHITGVNSSVVVAQAHQLRIHDCKNTVFYLDVQSQPVIERCADLKFTPLNYSASNLWSQVLDFQHPGSAESPNWTKLAETPIFQNSEGDLRKSHGFQRVRKTTTVDELLQFLHDAGVVGLHGSDGGVKQSPQVLEKKTG